MTDQIEYLIALHGSGDSYYTLVTKEIYDWVVTYNSFSSSENIPDFVFDQMQKYGQDPSEVEDDTSRYDANDRAIIALSAGQSFYTIMDVTNFVQKHNIVLKDEYKGHMY